MFKVLMLILMNQIGAAGFMGGEGGGNGDGGGDGDSGADGGGGIQKEALEPDKGDVAYPADLEKEYYGNATLMKHFDKEKGEFKVGGLMKGLIHATGMMGRDKMIVPHKDFTDDQWSETYAKLGLPKELVEYDVKNNVEEGALKDEKMFEGFKEIAHKSGILPKQAQAILDYYNTAMKDTISGQASDKQAVLEKSLTGLREEWGSDFERNIGVADHSLKEFASEEEIKQLGDMGMLDNPLVTKIFAKIGNAISDDKFVGTVEGNLGKSEESVRAEIESYYDTKHPYMNSTHPQNKYYAAKMMKMLESIHGKD